MAIAIFLYNIFMKIKSITSFLNELYPTQSAEAWDNVGLIIGNKKQIVSKVVIALDLTTEVFDKALSEGAELIITHHPFLFEDKKDGYKDQFKEFPYKESIYKRLINTGICVYSAHTSYDRAPKGMSLAFSKLFDNKKKSIKGVAFGFGNDVKTTFNKFETKLNKVSGLKIGFTNVQDKELKLSKVAFLPGTGQTDEIMLTHQDGYDLIVTADVKWSTWVLAKEHGINIAQVSHQMEEVFVNDIDKRLKKEYKELELIPMVFNKII